MGDTASNSSIAPHLDVRTDFVEWVWGDDVNAEVARLGMRAPWKNAPGGLPLGPLPHAQRWRHLVAAIKSLCTGGAEGFLGSLGAARHNLNAAQLFTQPRDYFTNVDITAQKIETGRLFEDTRNFHGPLVLRFQVPTTPQKISQDPWPGDRSPPGAAQPHGHGV